MSLLVEVQAALAHILRQADPVEARRRLCETAPHVIRENLNQLDADGLRISALLVSRIRFERILRTSSRAEQWFDAEPAAYTDAFRQYHAQVPMLEPGPHEGNAFLEWVNMAARTANLRRATLPRAISR